MTVILAFLNKVDSLAMDHKHVKPHQKLFLNHFDKGECSTVNKHSLFATNIDVLVIISSRQVARRRLAIRNRKAQNDAISKKKEKFTKPSTKLIE